MKIRAFPSINQYFNTALSALCDEGFNFREKKREEIIIVCMASWSLQDVVSAFWLKYWDKSKILIVSDSRFLPIAKYFQIKNRDIIEICHTLEFYGVLEDYLWRGKLYSIKQEFDTPHLTDMEYVSLHYALEGISVEKQAMSMGLSTKTIFTHRAASARKLRVKKLSHLFSPKILNACCS
ncbi:LuxR C-terminal-related transcriptional regulator [Erwinia aphidicola]|uniref:LuxR C-terminal-related transcriptional regulator n=1 Tax=Erwinia aphidicola TaxID=68334 RepID=A0ABU8DNJ1_ERWAP